MPALNVPSKHGTRNPEQLSSLVAVDQFNRYVHDYPPHDEQPQTFSFTRKISALKAIFSPTANNINQMARVYDPFSPATIKMWADELAAALGDLNGTITSPDLRKIFILSRPWRHIDGLRLAASMRSLGWERKLKLVDKHLRNVYVRGNTTEEQRRLIYILRDPISNKLYVGHDPPDFTKALRDAGVDPHGV